MAPPKLIKATLLFLWLEIIVLKVGFSSLIKLFIFAFFHPDFIMLSQYLFLLYTHHKIVLGKKLETILPE
jgi:hypothetical protein